ncbi:MAG TPA: tRNA (adenosine(37)-N6)-threonylcarbamoyltransferase complex ATPase subunit type 1 TsaE, partial [Acidobacteria bacterium]|nr:tRNA (adenosine(37)-N6)-threonylcarbamoyltransferase complex ATPase subunit type 1 TsaE [Acidobacteriota bacterium]
MVPADRRRPRRRHPDAREGGPLIVESGSPERTEAAGRELAALLAPGDLVLLEADLAAGKTIFVRGLVEGLGGDPAGVSSPTFVIVQTYPTGGGAISRLHHVDLYRLAEAGPEELRETGLEELLSDGRAVTAVEWPVDSVLRWLPRGTRAWRIRIAVEPG